MIDCWAGALATTRASKGEWCPGPFFRANNLTSSTMQSVVASGRHSHGTVPGSSPKRGKNPGFQSESNARPFAAGPKPRPGALAVPEATGHERETSTKFEGTVSRPQDASRWVTPGARTSRHTNGRVLRPSSAAQRPQQQFQKCAIPISRLRPNSFRRKLAPIRLRDRKGSVRHWCPTSHLRCRSINNHTRGPGGGGRALSRRSSLS